MLSFYSRSAVSVVVVELAQIVVEFATALLFLLLIVQGLEAIRMISDLLMAMLLIR